MVAPEDPQPQVDAGTPEGAPEETTAPQDAAAAPQADTPATDAAGAEQAPEGAAAADDAAPDAADGATPTPDEAPATDAAPAEGDVPAGEVASVEADGAATEGAEGQAAEGEQTQGEGGASQGGEGEGGAKKRRRSRGRRSGRGGGPGGGRRRFAWDEVFLRQRLELLRSMDPDPAAIAWAVDTAGRFDVADILAGEGSSGREFGRRAYGAQPETEDQAAWIVLAAVRARDIVPIARVAVSTTDDQRQQVRDAIELLGIARVNPALQGDRPPQQVFAERARRVDVTVEGGEAQKAAWSLLALARPQDVKFAASPRPSGGPGGRRPGGPGRPGDRDGGERRGRGRREPGIPGGVFSVGESGIGSELGEKLRAALAQAEGKQGGDEDQQN